jgi:hypothetical protein
MNHERPDAVFYDSVANPRFRDALINDIVVPAYFSATLNESMRDGLSNITRAERDVWDEDSLTEYRFVADNKTKKIKIISKLNEQHLNEELTQKQGRLIADEIKTSTVPEWLKERYEKNANKIVESGSVELFTRRVFSIDLGEEDSFVRVEIEIGYSVDGVEVISQDVNKWELSEFEMQRGSCFEVNEILEIVRALVALELITDVHVKRFLEQDF